MDCRFVGLLLCSSVGLLVCCCPDLLKSQPGPAECAKRLNNNNNNNNNNINNEEYSYLEENKRQGYNQLDFNYKLDLDELMDQMEKDHKIN